MVRQETTTSPQNVSIRETRSMIFSRKNGYLRQSQFGIKRDWVQATPRTKDGSVTQLRVGFRGKDLAALEIVDAFGQRSQLLFTAVQQGLALPADRFRFVPPPGADFRYSRSAATSVSFSSRNASKGITAIGLPSGRRPLCSMRVKAGTSG